MWLSHWCCHDNHEDPAFNSYRLFYKWFCNASQASCLPYWSSSCKVILVKFETETTLGDGDVGTVDRSGVITGVMYYEMKAEMDAVKRRCSSSEAKVNKVLKENEQLRKHLAQERWGVELLCYSTTTNYYIMCVLWVVGDY